MKLFLLLCTLAVASAGNKIRYDNYKVFRITPQTDDQAAFLAGLEDKGCRFWEGPSNKAGRPNDIMFPPHMQGDLLDYIRNEGMIVEDFVDNVQALMDNEVVSYEISPKLTWDAYHPYETIVAWMEAQVVGKPGATVEVLGKSFLGADIKYVKIEKNAANPWIWVDANIHAREWITNTIATYLIDKLLNDPQYAEYTNNFNFIIAPMLNPDGYAYSRSNDRLWRKTRRPNAGSSCAGTDANRNFGFHWMEGGASNNPCSETYGGDAAFSEPETALVRDFLSAPGKNWVFYLSIHSYSQLILLSYGLNEAPGRPWLHPEHTEHLRIGRLAADAHRVRYGTQFRAGNIVELLYVASGGSMDWALGARNIPLGVTYEMRDTGTFGFVLPPNQIMPSCQEWMDGFQVYYNELMNKYHPTKV